MPNRKGYRTDRRPRQKTMCCPLCGADYGPPPKDVKSLPNCGDCLAERARVIRLVLKD